MHILFIFTTINIIQKKKEKEDEEEEWKSYEACPNFYPVARGLPTVSIFTGSVRDTNEVTFVFTPPGSY